MQSSIHLGDARTVLSTLPEASFDAVCTDPPYEIAMMGRSWDRSGISFDPAFWELCLRVLKPGGHLIAFGAPQTHHRIWCAIDDAGFQIRDTLQWLRGRGYPKSRALLKPCSEPILLARRPLEGTLEQNEQRYGTGALCVDACRVGTTKNVPASPRRVHHSLKAFGAMGAGEDGAGFDPNIGRYPPNVLLSHLPDCELAGQREVMCGTASARSHGVRHHYAGGGMGRTPPQRQGFEKGYADACGKESVEDWHCAPGCPVAELDAQSGLVGQAAPVTGHEPSHRHSNRVYASNASPRTAAPVHDAPGSASRFFPTFQDTTFRYIARPSPVERNAGCEDFFWRRSGSSWERVDHEVWEALPDPERCRGNVHPTIKPLGIMRWLVRLVCPPEGRLLDPFLGSGGTMLACLLENISCVGIELDPDHFAIARARAEWVCGDRVTTHGVDLPPRPTRRQGELFT